MTSSTGRTRLGTAVRGACAAVMAFALAGSALGPIVAWGPPPPNVASGGEPAPVYDPPPVGFPALVRQREGVVTADLVVWPGDSDSVVPAWFVAPTPDKAGVKGGDTVAKVDDDSAPKIEPEKPVAPWYSIHEQGTIVTEKHDVFNSPYAGVNSLVTHEPAATTETATLFAVARLWTGGPEVVFNPEIAGGKGFSGTMGLAGFPNGEATRVGIPEPTPYIARLLVRQTWGLEGSADMLDDAQNQIAGRRDVDRFTAFVGKMSASDVADNNRYSHDPRTQFLNWSIMYNGAWDYPANVRGYTYGGGFDFNTVFWAVHYGIFAEPASANGGPIDPRFLKANGQILEIEEHWGVDGLNPGKFREWVFLNHARMGNYDEALAERPVNPIISDTRSYRFKYGFGFNLEQELTKDLGLFAKYGWNDGHSETWAFTEIDRTAAVGLLLKGKSWGRPTDEVGLAMVVNGLSGPHRAYLAAGGIGFIVGDGQLSYQREEIVEGYYNWAVSKGIFVTLDGQAANNPAYNAARGPVVIGTIRLHLEH